MNQRISDGEMVRALAKAGYKRAIDSYTKDWYWRLPDGRGKPTTEIAYGYLMSQKNKGEP